MGLSLLRLLQSRMRAITERLTTSVHLAAQSSRIRRRLSTARCSITQIGGNFDWTQMVVTHVRKPYVHFISQGTIGGSCEAIRPGK